MTDHDIMQFKYWLDMAIKAIIGVVISIVGLDYRAVKNSLHDLEENKYRLASEIAVVRVELTSIKERLERIDNKLDRAIK